MKILHAALICATSLGLAACSGAPETSDGDIPREPAEAASVNLMQPGLYAVGDGTQVYSQTRLNADGSYVDLDDAGEQVGGGTWQQRGNATCFDPTGDGEDQQERCWNNDDPNPDGSFTTTRDDGSESYTVTPIEE